MLDKVKDEISKKLRYYPFKKWVLTKIMSHINSYVNKAVLYDRLIDTLIRRERILKKEIELMERGVLQEIYIYPKQVADGEKTAYEYSEYVKRKIEHKQMLAESDTIKDILNNYKLDETKSIS